MLDVFTWQRLNINNIHVESFVSHNATKYESFWHFCGIVLSTEISTLTSKQRGWSLEVLLTIHYSFREKIWLVLENFDIISLINYKSFILLYQIMPLLWTSEKIEIINRKKNCKWSEILGCRYLILYVTLLWLT